jgi:hypothetical protein
VTTDTNIVPRLKAVYNDEIRGKLLTELGLSNVMEVPRLEKIVINVGCRRCHRAQAAHRQGRRRDHDHRRPEAGRDPGEEVDRWLQAP